MERLDIEYDEVPDASDWVFCVGPARTGSSAITKVISLHPDALVYNEAWLGGLMDLIRQPVLEHDNTSANTKIWLMLQEYVNRDAERFGYTGYHENWPKFPASVLREYMEGVRSAFERGGGLFGDKRGNYRLMFDDLLFLFPNCKLVYTDRNDWDSIASAFRHGRERGVFEGLNRKETARECHRRIVARNKFYQDNLNLWDRNDCDVHVVQFEDMASDLKGTTEELLNYLELDVSAYPWDTLPEVVHYKQAVGRQKDVPEVMELKERKNGYTGR